ncbi:hypothetical protein DH2020_016912 [Rehmannia glutinosa]|uniref:Uncharacterized protein n=1 Tax=Rehmannia glutinosa TaxID=99300 RepID=A0ABR0WPC1_REHGL
MIEDLSSNVEGETTFSEKKSTSTRHQALTTAVNPPFDRPDPIGKEIANDVFCLLSVYEENAITIVEHLVRILRGDDVGAKAAAGDVMWDISSYKYSSAILQNSGAIPVLVELLKDENIDVKEKVAGAVAQLSHDEADRTVLADCGAIPCLITMLEDESDELRNNVTEALINFSLDPLIGDQISCVIDNPLFQNMHDRVIQMRASDEYLEVWFREHLDISLRHISIKQLT